MDVQIRLIKKKQLRPLNGGVVIINNKVPLKGPVVAIFVISVIFVLFVTVSVASWTVLLGVI